MRRAAQLRARSGRIGCKRRAPIRRSYEIEIAAFGRGEIEHQAVVDPVRIDNDPALGSLPEDLRSSARPHRPMASAGMCARGAPPEGSGPWRLPRVKAHLGVGREMDGLHRDAVGMPRTPSGSTSIGRSSRLLRPRLGGNWSSNLCLTNQLFGRRDTPVIIYWIFAAHQIGGALAAFGADAVRSFSGDYLLAFMTSGLACLLALLLVLRVSRPAPAIVPAV
jgi:hypothetical protein